MAASVVTNPGAMQDQTRTTGFLVKVWAVLVGGGVLATFFHPGILTLSQFTADEIVRLFTELGVIALVIERSVEVFITPLRGEKAEHLARARKLDHPEAKTAEIQYRGLTRKIAFLTALALGMAVSTVGVRILSQLVQAEALSDPSKTRPIQLGFFTLLDILLTGALLAGGSDGMHKLASVFTGHMEAAAEASKRKRAE